jgi:hypothetical protein
MKLSAIKVCVIIPSYFPTVVYGGPIFSVNATNEVISKLGIKVYVPITNANGKSKLDVEPNIFNRSEFVGGIRYTGKNVIRNIGQLQEILSKIDIY